MKKTNAIWLSLTGLLLCACSGAEPQLTDYVEPIPLFASKDDVKVLQLTDIHWSFGTDYAKEKAYLTYLVQKADPDFIMATGDSFLSANATTVNVLWDLFDSWKIPWAFVYGNHDEQGTYNPHYVSEEALKRQYCYNSEIAKDNVYGDSNFVINLSDGSGDVKWQLYGIDSNSLHFNGLFYDYDVIHQDQIDWYEKEVNLAKSQNGGAIVPSLAFFHIPLWQWTYAYRQAQSETEPNKFLHGGEMREKVYDKVKALGDTRSYTGYADSGFFKKAEELASTKAMFCGHDHINDFYSVYRDESWPASNTDDGILVAYGLKSGDGLYFDPDMIGGNLVTIHRDGSFAAVSDFKQLFVTYGEAGL